MKHLKEALKNKMVKTVNIHIHEPMEDKTSDLAPMVKDEPGVDNDAMMDLQSMIDKTPDHPTGGKSLDGKAKELMLAKMANMKKGLKA